MKLTTIFLLLSMTAFGQEVIWNSPPLKTPLIRGNRVIQNDSTVAVLYGLEAKPGFRYEIREIAVSDSVLVQAESFTGQSGIVVSGSAIGGVDKTDWIKYSVNFKRARTVLVYRYAMSDATNGKVDFRTGSITGPIIATIDLTPTGGWGTYVNKTVTINYGSDAVTDIYLTFTNSTRTTGSGGNIDWWYVK